ncbi:hypothetical protein IAR55_000961 [Kwoniella newhampshirensis]|uniref:Box C/D snoRNA protein 1 n=1 Tax=Kwoniella newhampshirensis TaxID=1651941 RepID=A0AAW0Z4I1_9TREE
MSFSLPPRPGSYTSPVAGPSRPAPTSSLAADPNQCAICSQPAKYTCPRCSRRTCSLPCSRTHKARDSCSGVRDPAKYVPLKEYGQGAWSDDYRWLEEGRRKVGGWGEGVKVEEISSGPGRGGMRAGSRGGGPGGHRRSNRSDGLRKELAQRGCEVSFMPEGMGRKKANQSSWNPRTQQLHLTVHISVPLSPFDSTSATTTDKVTAHSRVLFAASDSTPLPTLSSLLPPPVNETLSGLISALPFHSTPSCPAPDHTPGQKLFYPPLDASKPLAEVLRGTAWVEFPVIHVMTKKFWETSLDNGTVKVVPLSQGRMQTRDSGWGAKRRVAVVEESEKGDDESVKKAKTIAAALNITGSAPAEGLMALGEYESDVEDDEDVEGEMEAEPSDGALRGGEIEEGEDGGVNPPAEVLEAVGMALIADLGEA